MRRWRSIYRHLLPSWLATGDGDKLQFTIGVLADAFIERIHQGIYGRFPRFASDSMLALIGHARQIPRGRDETSEHYAARLRAWRNPGGHRRRGNAAALLEQVSEYFGGVRCWTIDQNGNRYTRNADGTLTVEHGIAWDWDGGSALWRFWLGIDFNPDVPSVTEHPTIGDPALWGGLTIGEAGAAGYTIGQAGVSFEDCRAIANLFQPPAPWKPANAIPVFAVITLEDYTSAGFPAPDGTWDTASGRDPDRRYWTL